MKPYGLRKHDDLIEHGPPSRVDKIKAKQRKESRRLLHKQARNDVKKDLKSDP